MIADIFKSSSSRVFPGLVVAALLVFMPVKAGAESMMDCVKNYKTGSSKQTECIDRVSKPVQQKAKEQSASLGEQSASLGGDIRESDTTIAALGVQKIGLYKQRDDLDERIKNMKKRMPEHRY